MRVVFCSLCWGVLPNALVVRGYTLRRLACACPAQVVLVSATLPHEVLEMTHKFMTDPVRILVKRDELTLEVGGMVQGWG